MFSSKLFLNILLLFCYVCNVKAKPKPKAKPKAKPKEELMYLDVCRKDVESDFRCAGYLVRKTYKPIVDEFFEKNSVNYCIYCLNYWEKEELKEKDTEQFYLISVSDLPKIQEYLNVKKTEEKFVKYDAYSKKPFYTYYQVFTVGDLLYSVEIKDDLKKIINDYSIKKSNLLDGGKKTKKEITDDYFIKKKICDVTFEEKDDIKNCKAKITYKGDIKKFADDNKGYILMCKMNKELTEELENISKDTSDFKKYNGLNFLNKHREFFDNYQNLTAKDAYEEDFYKIYSDLKEKFNDKLKENNEKIAEKQKYLIETLDCYLKELNDTSKEYSDVEKKFSNFVNNEESKYKSLLEGDNLINYDNKKLAINTKITEIKNKISDYNNLKTSIETTINNIINDVKGYSKTETIDNFNKFIEQKNKDINAEKIKLDSYETYVADYNAFFTTLITTFNEEVNRKKSEIELDKIKDTNVKKICDVIIKTINDYIGSFDSITDIDDSKLGLQDTNIVNEINNIISTNLDEEIKKDHTINKEEVKTKVNEFFTTGKINSYKSIICDKINNKTDTLKITFTLTVKNNLKLKQEFSNKLEIIKNKYSNGVTNSVTFDNLRSEISEKKNDVKLFVNNSEVNYSEKITKGTTISVEFSESYLIIKKPEEKDDDPEKHKNPDDDTQDDDDKKENQEICKDDTTVLEKKKVCYNRKSNNSSKCSGRNKD